ncbi:amidophosphoribosyltransferase [Schaalia odontolytica]|uniref:amidophosphoribosyltransferase n=1 Tax=Schaalia odontolytica TaxID=1660 RepID=UPI00211CADC5|nr:amidophosphoribosyltransferase [Schaalia odontolytica]UUO92990.1 amidophosphoribosyltransferase [Schaalia odontolytica]
MLPVSQPDMTLSDQELFGDDHPRDHCGVFGVWAPGEDVSRLTYFSLYALQHRGQQSAGIATSNGKQILVYKDQGLVSHVFSEQSLQGLRGHIALGHVRYATTGADVWRNAQPTLGPTPTGTLALAHNGNLTNTVELRELARSIAEEGEDFERGASTDTSLVTALLGMAERIPGPSPFIAAPTVTPAVPEPHGDTPASSADRGGQASGVRAPTEEAVSGENPGGETAQPEPAPLVGAALKVLPRIKGAFSLVFMDENTLYAARDPHGYRPLVLGRLASGWVVASETAALDLCGATVVREIEPGELISIDASGVHSRRFAVRRANTCVFEYVYLARPDTTIGGRRIVAARHEMGAALARENPVEADLVMPTPDSGTPAAIGYAQEAGIPFAQGLVKNAYVGRTFIEPTQSLRQLGIRLKLNPLREVIEGKRLVVIDDSIVRGNTQRALVRMLREAGAQQVHVRISSPPVAWPCFFGIDFPTRAELIASSMSVEQVRDSLGADSLAYLSIDGMVAATGQGTSLCLGCFTGHYPETIPSGTPVPGTPGANAC